MPEQTFDPNQPFTVEEAPTAPAQPQEQAAVGEGFRAGVNPFRDEDFPEYARLVTNRNTTPAQLIQWMEERGYGRTNNAAEILTFHRRNPQARPANSFNLEPSDPPIPDSMPQPGTPTDWLPDFIQDDVERVGLSLGIIDPSTYYGLGNYGENARRPNQPGRIRNTEDDSLTIDEAARSFGMGVRGLGTGLGSLADIVAGPVNMAINALPGEQGLSTTPFRDFADAASDSVGLATPQTSEELLANSINEGGIQALATLGASAPLTAAKGATGIVANAIASSPRAEILGSIGSNVSAELTRQSGGGPVAQTLAAIAGGGLAGTAGALRDHRTAPHTAVEEAIAEPAQLNQLNQNLALLAERSLTKNHFRNVDEIASAAATLRSANPETSISSGQTRPEPATNSAPVPDRTPQPEDDVVQRLTAALTDANRVSQLNAERLSAFRRDQAARLSAVRNRAGVSGEAQLNAELGALRGSAEREGLPSLREQFTTEEIDSLFTRIDSSPAFRNSVFGSINARIAFRKILEGETPTPSELDRLSEVFPPDFIRATLSSRRGQRHQLWTEVLNAPRAMLATLDFSAPLRQGVVFAGRREFYNAFPHMFGEFARAFRSNDSIPTTSRGSNWQPSGSVVYDEIRMRPSFENMETSGLSLSRPHSINLLTREEDFISHLPERIPGFGRFARASNAAYAGFLNRLRADVFDSMTSGQNLSPEELRGVSRYINSATGRGDLGSLNRAAPILNAALFSPRLIRARIDMLNPVFYARLPPVARRQALSDMLRFGGLVGATLSLAHMAGYEVGTDPRSSEFLKIKAGNTRIDVTGGFSQYVTLASRLFTGETVTTDGNVRELNGEGINRSRAEALGAFARNKLAPVPGYVWTALDGSNPVGEPYDPVETTLRTLVPLYVQGLEGLLQDDSLDNRERAALAILSLFGVGVNSYRDRTEPEDTVTNRLLESATGVNPSAEFNPNEAFEVEQESPEIEPELSSDNGPVFDPNQPFDTTTSANLEAADILSNMGFQITDDGIRSGEEQANYYSNTRGAAAPGTSLHESGNAIDIRVPQGVRPSDIVAELTARGFRGVTIITRRHGTGPHWHIQWESAGE